MRYNPEPQPNPEVPRRTLVEWLVRNFRRIQVCCTELHNDLEGIGGVVSYGASITADVGDGSAAGDLNATDFTGHPYSNATTPTSLDILINSVVTFEHKSVAYLWNGPRNVTVGVGGTHTAVATDLTPIGTADHSLLSNRTIADQHPTSAITNLDNQQATQDANIQTNANNLATHIADTSNPHVVNHSQLPDVDPDTSNPHPQYQLILPGMVLGGSADSFTLNSTDSKLENYGLSGEYGGSSGNVDATDGEITIPSTGLYAVTANVLGLQGNDTKEEWIELKLDVAVVNPERATIGFLDVTTDKTSFRQVQSSAVRQISAGSVLSLYMWASSGLGTFTVGETNFSVARID